MFLKNKNIIFKIRRSKVTDYAALIAKCVTENYFSYFSTKTYVVGTQKTRLNETVLLSTKNMFKVMGKKIMTILCSKILPDS